MPDINQKFRDFLENFMGACNGLQSIDGEILVHNGEVVDKNTNIDETRLSNTEKEALDEFNYLEKRKKGEKINPEEKEKIERINRDILETRSHGFIDDGGN